VTTREVRVSGLEYLRLATALLQRARLADAEAGIWEAADLQWWWRTPRRSDTLPQRFWVDDDGPVAAVVLTEWRHAWGCEPLLVPGSSAPALADVWASALDAIDELSAGTVVEVSARDDDGALLALLEASGFVAGPAYGETWLDPSERPGTAPPPPGFAIVDRLRERERPHPMRHRNGPAVEARLRECSLYDPELDLAVLSPDGEHAGYALFWHDAATGVGLLEPMRVEDAYQRRGLARALVADGIARLAQRGARRIKVSYASDAARRLYTGAGFRVASTSRVYAR
jgi:predicted N-acetyltransferase YhbS